MKQIALSGGGVAIVDDIDFEDLIRFKWHRNSHGYAQRMALRRDEHHSRSILMHRQILGVLRSPSTVQVDHADGNPLNNSRNNLRLATKSQNGRNAKLRKDNRLGIKGVKRMPGNLKKPFRSRIRLNGKEIHLGYSATPEEAHAAYCAKSVELFGEFARFK